MGSPTDELRARLDELGVEWETPEERWNADSITYWKVGNIKWVAFESENDTLWLNCNSITDVSPEQAIAATVGAETCKRVYHPNRITKTCTCSNCGYGASDERWAYCPKCGHKYVHGEVEERWRRAGRKVAE